MKKILQYLSASIFIFIVTNTASTFAISTDNLIAADTAESKYQVSPIPKPNTLPGIDINTQSPDGTLQTQNILVSKVLPRFALGTIGVVGALSILFLVIGGVRFAMSYGQEEAVENAKKQITWSLVGFLISILSYTIVSIIINLEFKSDKQTQDEFCINAYGKPCDELTEEELAQ